MNILRTLTATLAAVTMLSAGAVTTAQRFYNLTAAEVRVDSVLPRFTCSIPLGGSYADSVYTVSIAYPEFINMAEGDAARFRSLTEQMPGRLPEVTSHVAVDRRRGTLEVSFVPVVTRRGRLMKLVSFMIDVKSEPRPGLKATRTATRATEASSRYASSSVLATGRWAKIRVPETGIYRLTDELVRRAGFTDASSVKLYGYGGALQRELITEDALVSTDDLQEVPTCTVNGQRLFHAQGPVSWSSETTLTRTRNPYSDYGYYFLTDDGGEPLTVDSTAFVDSFYPSADYCHALHEVDNYAWFQGGRNLYENSPIQAGGSKKYTLLPGSGQSGEGRVFVRATAGSATTLTISVNGELQGSYSLTFGDYDHGKAAEVTCRIPTPADSLNVTVSCVSGGPVRLDYISAVYDDMQSRPTLAGTTFPVPEYVYNITNQNHHADPQADMVIIVPASQKLTAQAQRIKEMHEQRDGMRVNLVPADELYNEFASGTPDANAYRRYLKMLYDRAETEADMPKYLLLFGDGVWDNRLNTQDCASLSADDLLLCYESDNSFSSTDCYVDDGFFALLDDGEGGALETSDKPDVAVGRFPVRTEEQAKAVVDKTLAYAENANAGSWQNVMVFMGDDGNQNKLMKDADDIATLAETLCPAAYVRRIMWDAYTRETSSTGNTYPDVTKLIKEQQQEGALIMNYCGHGSADQLSHEKVLTRSDFAAFTNQNLPLWITASCDIMPYDMQSESIGENAVLNADGGAVAFFGTARTVYITENRALNYAFIRHLLTPQDGEYPAMGEAMRLAKNEMITTGSDRTKNKLQYALLGDPALRLNLPRQALVVDSINGVDISTATSLPAMKAGTVATVKGHVESAGAEDASFSGVVNMLVRDATKTVTCRLNNTSSDGADEAFVYTDRTKVLFNGTDSVRSGRFSVSFAVPKDIDYSDKTGLINLTAVGGTEQTTLNGFTESFTVGGSGSLETDSIGPSIYCYLNSPSFTNGGRVNTTPYFVAEISDKDGLNVSGSGIGHDLMLSVDNDPAFTFNLNDNFSYDFGSYTSGSTFYSIPELEEGKHTLTFRAWDIMNNPSTATLTFNVVKGLTPGIVDVTCSENPARESTTFIVTHDRSGTAVDIDLTVYDVSGRPLWKHAEKGVTLSGAYTVKWNLCTTGGARLAPGIYLCRVRMSAAGTGTASKTRKVMVIN